MLFGYYRPDPLCKSTNNTKPTHLLPPHSPPPTPLTSSHPTLLLPPHSPPPTPLTSSHPTLLLPPHSPPSTPLTSSHPTHFLHMAESLRVRELSSTPPYSFSSVVIPSSPPPPLPSPPPSPSTPAAAPALYQL
ncbi:unnamed protein product [Closterium sp. NIES-54]